MKSEKLSKKWLDAVFGPDSKGTTIPERAETSTKIFVRSDCHLAKWKPSATGLRLSAKEVLDLFGEDIFDEIDNYGSAIILGLADDQWNDFIKNGRKQHIFPL